MILFQRNFDQRKNSDEEMSEQQYVARFLDDKYLAIQIHELIALEVKMTSRVRLHNSFSVYL